MESTKLRIKNMVCDRCISTVKSILINAGLQVEHVQLGLATVKGTVSPAKTREIANELESNGFELLTKQSAIMVEQIKEAIITLVRSGELEHLNINISAYLESKLGKDYSTLTHLFGNHEKLSLEKFTILQKIELAKEWLHEDELSMSAISVKLGYSSAAYFSNQFKQITGYTPTEYKNQKPDDRQALDKL